MPSPAAARLAAAGLKERPACVSVPTKEDVRGDHSLLQGVVDVFPFPLDGLDEPSPLLQLLPQELDRLLQHKPLGAPLALHAGNKVAQPVESLADGLAALLFCTDGQPSCRGCDGRGRGRAAVPDAMWFCFFSSSVRRGLSSGPWPLEPASPAGEADLEGDDMGAVDLLGLLGGDMSREISYLASPPGMPDLMFC